MSSTLLFLVAAGLPLYCVGWIIYARFFHPYSNIPGPFLASVSRTWIAIHALKGDLEYVQRELHKRYGLSSVDSSICKTVPQERLLTSPGPIIRIAPNEVSISDTNAIKVIYAANGDFTKVRRDRPVNEQGVSRKTHWRRPIFIHLSQSASLLMATSLHNLMKESTQIDASL